MKKQLLALGLALALLLGLLAGCNGGEAPAPSTGGSSAPGNEAGGGDEAVVYPAGTVTIYGHGQPQYLQQYYDEWLERNRDIAPDVKIEIVQTEGAADSREKITMTYIAGALDDLPDAVFMDPVNLADLAVAGIIEDVTDFVNPYVGQMVDGAVEDARVNGRIYGLPESVRPQMLFYNNEIFEEYDIDPARMATMEGYLEVGRELKEKSGGAVYLSYIDPGSRTWRYWGRRGLMPQANARIWDDEGNVVIDTDPGAALALGFLDTLNSEGLLLKSTIMEPALYDATNNGEVATYNIGAFWDEFMRQNVTDGAGDWRVMPSPVFEDVGVAGAPVSSYFLVIEGSPYAGLMKKLWEDFTFDIEPREEWVNKMVAQNAPYANPISLDMLATDFWQEPEAYYGGQSFRAAEGEALANSAVNLIVTPQDAEADVIISAELEKYVAGEQTMEQAIANMGQNLRDKIGQAEVN